MKSIDLNRSMYLVLVGGMIASSLGYVLGLLLLQNNPPLQTAMVHYETLAEFTHALVGFQAPAVLMLATVILIATPFVRVFVSILVFMSNKDRKFMTITVLVFLILVASLLPGCGLKVMPS